VRAHEMEREERAGGTGGEGKLSSTWQSSRKLARPDGGGRREEEGRRRGGGGGMKVP